MAVNTPASSVLATATASAAIATATYTPAASQTAMVTGFVLSVAGAAVAAADVVNATITGLQGGTVNVALNTSSGMAIGVFPEPVQGSAPGQAIVVTIPAGGASSVGSLTLFGYAN